MLSFRWKPLQTDGKKMPCVSEKLGVFERSPVERKGTRIHPVGEWIRKKGNNIIIDVNFLGSLEKHEWWNSEFSEYSEYYK